jgi:hypothetical protein
MGGGWDSLFSPHHGTSSKQPWAHDRAVTDPIPPKFYKLEFTTYDGTEDPLNWLNHYVQFFRGQRTSTTDRTWLASYHLRGTTQTWYYTLEQDTGMPTWERFKELCHLQFGPSVQDSRLVELGRLQFHTTVQEFTERFNAVLCHTRNLNAVLKAELFVGGLTGPHPRRCGVAHTPGSSYGGLLGSRLRATRQQPHGAVSDGPSTHGTTAAAVTQAPTASSDAP